MIDPTSLKLFDQGGHGCLFRPGPSCDGGIDDIAYLTKIHLDDDKLQNEITISNEIKKIKNYKRYFSPVINSCKIDLAEIKDAEINKCDFIRENTYPSKKYVSTKTFYVDGINYSKYLKIDSSYKFVIEVYKKLLLSLNKLEKQGICHYDLKPGNIIIKTKTIFPIIIDYGITMLPDKIQTEEDYRNAFYVYSTDYLPWPIDTIIISYLVQRYKTHDTIVTIMDIKEIEKIINTKMDELAEIIDMPRASEYRIQKIQKAQSYENKTVKDVTKELLTHYREWDKYSVAIMTATIIRNNNYQWKGKIKGQIEEHLLI